MYNSSLRFLFSMLILPLRLKYGIINYLNYYHKLLRLITV